MTTSTAEQLPPGPGPADSPDADETHIDRALLAVAAVVVLGGWLVADVSWRWIFFINVPIGFVALLLALRILPRDVPAHDQKLDFVDFLLLSPGLALAIYGLAETNSAGGFGSAKVLVPLLAGIALLCAFVWHALRASAPLVDLRLFKDRTFAMSSTMLVLVVISVFGSFLLLPLYFQTVRAESALQSGLLLAPQGLGAMLAMPVAGILSDRMGPGKIVPFGLLAIIGAVLWLTQIGPDTSYVGTSIDLFVFGFGMGFTMMPTFTGAMQSIRKEAVARGSTALNILQQTGASIGTAVLTVILASGLTDRLGPGANAAGGGGSIGAAIPHHVASLMADAFGHTFWWALALLIAAFVFSLALPKRKPANATSGPPISMA
jgi:EmrB/QacA subfamily drug resistance transporter